jgi:hypothetical protein
MGFYEDIKDVAKQAQILKETNQVAFAESVQGNAINRVKEMISRKARTGATSLEMDIWDLNDTIRLDDVEVSPNGKARIAIDSLVLYFDSIGFGTNIEVPEGEHELMKVTFYWDELEQPSEVVVIEMPVDTSEVLVSAQEYTKLVEDSQKLDAVKSTLSE